MKVLSLSFHGILVKPVGQLSRGARCLDPLPAMMVAAVGSDRASDRLGVGIGDAILRSNR